MLKLKNTALLTIVFIMFCCLIPAAGTESGKIPEKLKILAVGNSFSSNSLYYVWEMADELGIKEVTVANLYIGSCSLEKHLKNATNDEKAYKYYKKTDGKWVVTKNVSISEALADEDWDYVMFLQYSGDAGKTSTYKPLNKLLKYVKKRVGANTKLIWNMVWAYQGDYKAKRFADYNYDQNRMYKKIVNATKKKVETNKNIAFIIPSGTAVRNARNSIFGDNFTTDGRHLTTDGKYIVGLTVVSKILDISPKKIGYCPDSISQEMREVALEASEKALENK